MANNKLNVSFEGGMNSHTAPLRLKDNECELIVNYNLNLTGALQKRSGYALYASNQVNNTKTQCGLIGVFNPNNRTGYSWLSVNSVNNRATYYHDGTVWAATDDSDGTLFDPAGNANQLYMTRFVCFLNYVFRLDGADAPKSFLTFTPDTRTTTNLTDNETSEALAINPSLGAVFQDRVYFNRIADGFRSRTYYSTLAVAGGTIAWNTNTTTGQWFDTNPDDGDFITAYENNGNHLLIFKNYSMYRWVFGQIEADRIIGVGTHSQESVKTDFERGITFFANQKGIYAYDGSNRPKKISRKIQEYIDAVSNWKYVAGAVDGDKYYLSVGDLTVNGRTISNAWLVYHIDLDAWSIYSLPMLATVFAEVTNTYPNKQIIFGTSNGYTYKLTTATSDVTNATTGTPISGEVISKEHLLVFPEKTTLENIDVLAIQGGNTSVSYQIDRNLIGREGDFISCKGGLNNRVNTFRVGKEMHTVRLRFADNSARSSVIEGYNLEHTPKKSR